MLPVVQLRKRAFSKLYVEGRMVSKIQQHPSKHEVTVWCRKQALTHNHRNYLPAPVIAVMKDTTVSGIPIQAYLVCIAGLVADYCNKVSVTIK